MQSKKKIVFFIALLVFSIVAICLPVSASTNDNIVIVDKSEKEYMILIDEISKNQFQFAFSLLSNEVESNLNYRVSTVDTVNSDSLNVAYINESIFDEYFASEGKAYLYVKDMEDKSLLAGAEVNLADSLDGYELALPNLAGQMIMTDATGHFSESNNDKGYDSTTTRGMLKISNVDNGATYYYDLVKVTSDTDDYGTLFNTAKTLGEDSDSTVEVLKNTKTYSELFLKLVEERDWKVMDDYTVLEPEDTKTGDRYIVFLKEVFDGTGETYLDVKYLTCTYDYDNEIIGEQTIEEVVNLPVTYDNITLLIVFGILFVVIISLIVTKILFNKKDTKNS